MNSHLITQIGQTHLSSKQNVRNLKDGSQVLVRVIADKGNGKYEGSMGGVRTYFQANNPLKTGSSFVANISVKNGQIQIHPKEIDSISYVMNELTLLTDGEQSNDVFAAVENQKLAQFISQFNVPSDNFSLHLFLQMKQLGMKFDGNLLTKIRNLAVKFTGAEKKTGELLLMLAKQGIDPSEEEIERLVLQLEKDFVFDEKNTLKSEKNSVNHGKKISAEVLNDFIDSIFGGINQDKIGLLTVMNQTSFSKNKNNGNNWIIIPYELVENEEEVYNLVGSGNIKLLVSGEKSITCMNISCKYKNDEAVFMLEFDRNKIKGVKFNVNRQDEQTELVEKLKMRLSRINENISVKWCDFSKLDGTGCENEQLILFSGEV